MCAETDYLLGRVYNLAEATGHLKNTYTIFVSDHVRAQTQPASRFCWSLDWSCSSFWRHVGRRCVQGEMNMEHRQVWKNSLYEPSARVPLIISGPGVAKGKVVSDTLVSLLDIYPVRAHDMLCCVLSDTMPTVELQL